MLAYFDSTWQLLATVGVFQTLLQNTCTVDHIHMEFRQNSLGSLSSVTNKLCFKLQYPKTQHVTVHTVFGTLDRQERRGVELSLAFPRNAGNEFAGFETTNIRQDARKGVALYCKIEPTGPKPTYIEIKYF